MTPADRGAGEPLTSRDRARLRALAHALDPIVQVGKQGITDAVAGEVERALLAHELIKVRLTGERGEREEMARALAARTESTLAGTIGRVAILYRMNPDPEKRRIRL
jgi:RNA-binding protein